jgi:tetratricopeptide (TPR) repeat protein
MAQRDFDEAIRLKADNGDAWSGRGLIHARQGQTKAAREAAVRALRPVPKTARLYLNVAHIYAQLARHAEASEPRNRVQARRQYQEEAVRLLVLALKESRGPAAFWRDNVRADQGLFHTLRGHPKFDELDARFPRPVR